FLSFFMYYFIALLQRDDRLTVYNKPLHIQGVDDSSRPTGQTVPGFEAFTLMGKVNPVATIFPGNGTGGDGGKHDIHVGSAVSGDHFNPYAHRHFEAADRKSTRLNSSHVKI